MVDIPDIKLLDLDELVGAVKDLVRNYGDELLALLFVMIFVWAGVQKMGYLG